jgi:hypothetical protein
MLSDLVCMNALRAGCFAEQQAQEDQEKALVAMATWSPF